MKKSSFTTQTPISNGNMNPKQMFIFSWFFLGSGLFITSIPFDYFGKTSSSMRAPKEIVLMAGAIFLLAGLSVLTQSIKKLKEKSKLESLKKRNSSSPWKGDYLWSERGISPRSKSSFLHHFCGLSIILSFLAITYWIGFILKGGIKAPFYGMCFFVLIIFIWFYSMLSKRLKYGKPFLKFNQFPFHLGNNINVTFTSLPPKSEVKEVILTIRHYEEVFTKNMKGETRISLKKHFEDSKVFQASQITSNRTLKVEMDLPQDLEFVSKLNEMPAKFWEIQIQCDIEGWDYREYYLLPIYGP